MVLIPNGHYFAIDKKVQSMKNNLFLGDVSQQVSVSAPRIHYFDWLRAIAVLGVVAYHTVLPFARDTWSIVNDQQSPMLLAFVYVLESFGLGVLFLIAGASVRFALQRRSMGAFLRERIVRLLMPYIIGAIVLIPPASYLIGLHQGSASGSFLSYLGEYPRLIWINNIALKGFSPEVLTYAGMHLWFLAWLFICSVLALPIFAFLGSSAGRWLVNGLGRLSRCPGALLLLGVPMVVPRIILSVLPMEQTGWSLEAFVWYAIVFVIGYLMYCDDRLVAAARRDLWLVLIVAILGSFAFIFPELVWQLLPWTYAFVPFWMGVMGVTGWAWALAILSVGMRAGFMQRPLPSLASEAALPAYILHFPLVIGISALVVDSSLGFGDKILINLILGVGATLLLSAIALRASAFRRLLGIRPTSEHRPLAAGQAEEIKLTLDSLSSCTAVDQAAVQSSTLEIPMSGGVSKVPDESSPPSELARPTKCKPSLAK